MPAHIQAPETPSALWPLDHAAMEKFPLAGMSFADHRSRAWDAFPGIAHVFSNAWVAAADVKRLANAGEAALADANGRILAWFGTRSPQGLPLVAASAASWLVRFPWDLLEANEQAVDAIQESRIAGDLSPAAHLDGILVLGEGSRVLPGVYIEGRVVIGRNCKIGPNAYLRGNTSIGDGCHIGQAVEIKNSLIGPHTNIGHLSYVGDSILANRVNFGAGTITSNLRHDGTTHRSLDGTTLVDTGRRKFGCVVGPGVHTGIHTAIYPGRKLGPNTTTPPAAAVHSDLT